MRPNDVDSRDGHGVLVPRLALVVALVVAVWATYNSTVTWSLLVAAIGVVAVAVVEQLAFAPAGGRSPLGRLIAARLRDEPT